MEAETHRKLVLTYHLSSDDLHYHNIEMKFAKPESRFVEDKIPGRIFPSSDADVDYAKHIKEVCNTLNKEIKKLVDNAQFHIVEVNIIK